MIRFSLRVLPDTEADFLVSVADKCRSKKTRAPWLEIIGSLATPKARAFVNKHR